MLSNAAQRSICSRSRVSLRDATLQNSLNTPSADMMSSVAVIGFLSFDTPWAPFYHRTADNGIAAHVDDSKWQTIVDEFTHHVRTGEVERGFLQTIASCGALLQEIAPATSVKNELPNHLVLID